MITIISWFELDEICMYMLYYYYYYYPFAALWSFCSLCILSLCMSILLLFSMHFLLFCFFWGQRNQVNRKQLLNPSVQELASRAASRVTIEYAKNITPPSSAYQFEVSWRGLSGDRALQTNLLKVCSRSVTISFEFYILLCKFRLDGNT